MACCALLRKNLRRLSELPGEEQRFLAEAWLALLAADLVLRLVPIGRLQTRIMTPLPRASATEESGERSRAQRACELVGIAARHHLYPMRCLRQAVALQWMLKRRGLTTVLRIGVQRGEAELHAHAWLEYAGQPLGQPEGICRSYAPLLPVASVTDDRAATNAPR